MTHSRFTRKTIVAAVSLGLASGMALSPALTMSAFAEDRPAESNVNDAQHYTLGYPTYRMANPGETIDIKITETSHTDDLPEGTKFTLDEGKYGNGIPEGMSIDEQTGDVSFNVPQDFWAPEFAYIKVEFPDGSDRSFDVTIYPRDGEDNGNNESNDDQNNQDNNQDNQSDDSNQIDEIQNDDNQDQNGDNQDQNQDQNDDNYDDQAVKENADDNDDQGNSEGTQDGSGNRSSGGRSSQIQRQVQFNVPGDGKGVKYTLIYPNGEKYSFSSAEEAQEFAANKKNKKMQSQNKVVSPQQVFHINGFKVSVFKSSDFK